MTENQAINELIDYRACSGTELPTEIEVAIQALKEIQQYRAIGTVEDIQEVMALCKSLQETVCKYMDIGTIEEFKALKEKSEPKKPIKHGLRKNKVMCPHCTNWLEAHSSKVFCCYCGRKIDWN